MIKSNLKVNCLARFALVVLSWLLLSGLFPVVGKVQVTASETTSPQERIIEAKVVEVLEEGKSWLGELEVEYQLLRLQLLTAEPHSPTITLRHGGIPLAQLEQYQPNQRVFLNLSQPLSSLDLEQELSSQQAVISGPARNRSVYLLLGVFVLVVAAVNGTKGLRSFLSLGLSFAAIFMIALPLLLRGMNPIVVALSLALVIIPVTFYITHGVSKKTHVAVTATIMALIVSSLLAVTFINTTQLSGLASEEAGFLSAEKRELINPRGLLLAGIILGLLGTLDDITVTQAGLVFTLKKNNKKLSLKTLYRQAMEIGQDHISSMVNTLMLVYAGASLPLLLLFVDNPHPLAYVLSQEIVVEEIVRMLVSSIGLVLAAPMTTLLAAAVANWQQVKAKVVVK